MDIYNLLENRKIDEIIELIENNKLDINFIDDFSYSLLMKAINRGLSNLSIYLIKKGVNLNYQNNKGQSILHLLAIYYDEIVLKMALEKGADVNLVDKYGNEALWTAVFNDKGLGHQRKEMIALLIDYGANPNHINNAGRSPKQFAIMANYSNEILNILNKANGKD